MDNLLDWHDLSRESPVAARTEVFKESA